MLKLGFIREDRQNYEDICTTIFFNQDDDAFDLLNVFKFLKDSVDTVYHFIKLLLQ